MNPKRIHITGASGSGTTTLGKALAEKLNYIHIDTDNYFWITTDPPYQEIRELEVRQKLLESDMLKYKSWVSSGSMCGWADFAIKYFDFVIFLYIPHDIRIQRLLDREKHRSPESFLEGTIRNKQFEEFIDWAKKYDTAGTEIRSLVLHQGMLQKLTCPYLKIEGEVTVAESVKKIEEFIKNT